MSGRRFPLQYDDEFDRDIHDLLDATPPKRRSERIRHLIRLGLTVESQSRTPPTVTRAEVMSTPASFEESAEPLPRRRGRIRFDPPTS